jgi:hypothetical protein
MGFYPTNPNKETDRDNEIFHGWLAGLVSTYTQVRFHLTHVNATSI